MQPTTNALANSETVLSTLDSWLSLLDTVEQSCTKLIVAPCHHDGGTVISAGPKCEWTNHRNGQSAEVACSRLLQCPELEVSKPWIALARGHTCPELGHHSDCWRTHISAHVLVGGMCCQSCSAPSVCITSMLTCPHMLHNGPGPCY